MLNFIFYFDESGNFEEHTLLEDLHEPRTEPPQAGASQLVGVLAQTGQFAPSVFEDLLAAAHRHARLPLERQCHATDLLRRGGQAQYALLLTEFLDQVERSPLQPVRLCNNARLGFGDKVTTYTCMVAELVVHIFEELTRKFSGVPIGLKIVAARVRTNGQEKNAPQIFIDQAEYKRRLDEQIAFTAIRRGGAHNHGNWHITGFDFGSGLSDRPLQVCDLLSNASYQKFKNCSSGQKRQLKSLFECYDFVFNRSDVLLEIEHHSRDGSLSHAVQTIAENWNGPEFDQSVRQGIKQHCTHIVEQLAGMPASGRNIHLRQLADWGSQFLAVRDLALADQMLQWLEKQIAEPLARAVADPVRDDVCWFLAQLLVLRLEQHNHRGELSAARPICDRLHELFAPLAGQWEHASLLSISMARVRNWPNVSVPRIRRAGVH